jgi:hypothetical protein
MLKVCVWVWNASMVNVTNQCCCFTKGRTAHEGLSSSVVGSVVSSVIQALNCPVQEEDTAAQEAVQSHLPPLFRSRFATFNFVASRQERSRARQTQIA